MATLVNARQQVLEACVNNDCPLKLYDALSSWCANIIISEVRTISRLHLDKHSEHTHTRGFVTGEKFAQHKIFTRTEYSEY